MEVIYVRAYRFVVLVLVAAFVFTSCGGTSATQDAGDAGAVDAKDAAATESFSERVDAIGNAVDAWRDAVSIAAAHAAAEMVLNLVVGPNGPGYGDRDSDLVVNGATDVGLLPGLDGAPSGLAEPLRANECVTRDVLGGTWSDPSAEWAAMLAAVDQWRPDNNTMPTLPSHPMRVVGWATFTLDSDSLDDAHEYAGHANLHVNITRRALDC
jgi:hypothetical protein